MGKDLFDSSPAAREVYERADEALGYSISKMCFEGPDDDLTLTANTQPAILTTSIAALATLREKRPELPLPIFAAGHSLGEYSALVAAGAMTLEQAVKLVHLRGKAMQDAVPPGDGAMAAVMGGTPESVQALCDDAREDSVLSPANFNAPGQIVIAGSAAAVGRAQALAGDRKMKAIPLKVSAPFHCALMEPAARAVETALESVSFGEMSFPVVANVDATPNADASRVADLLVRQGDNPVRWTASVLARGNGGAEAALEIGTGRVLAGLIRKIHKELSVQGVGAPAAVEALKGS